MQALTGKLKFTNRFLYYTMINSSASKSKKASKLLTSENTKFFFIINPTPTHFHHKLKANSIWCMKYHCFYIKASSKITIFETTLCFIGHVFVETKHIVFHEWYWNCARYMHDDNGWVSGWFKKCAMIFKPSFALEGVGYI